MAAFLSKLESYILFLKYYTLYYTSEAVYFLKYNAALLEGHIEKIVNLINSKASAVSDVIAALSSKLNLGIKAAVKPNINYIVYALLSYAGLYIFSYTLAFIYRSLKVKKLLKKDPYFAKLFESRKVLNIKKITSKDFYLQLSGLLGKAFSKIFVKALFSLWDIFGDLKIFKDKNYILTLSLKASSPFIKVLDILAVLLEKGLVFIKIIEPKSKDVNVFLSNVRQKDLETLKKEIPEELHKEFYLDETTDEETYFELIGEYRKHTSNAYHKWQEDELSSMLIIGKPGCGKSSFIDFLLKKYFKTTNIIRYEFLPSNNEPADFNFFLNQIFKTSDIEGITEKLPSGKSVVVLDNFHFIFNKSTGNYNTISSFLNLIGKSIKNILFVVTINEYSYNFLSSFLPIKNAFDFKLNLNLMKGFDIKKIFLAKAAKIGYTIYPRLSENQIKLIKRKIKKGELAYPELTNYVLSEYFGKLVDNCENIFPALYYYFLSSITKVENNRIYISEAAFPDLGFTGQFNQVHYLILVAVITHETLKTDELSNMLDMDRARINIEASFLIKNSVLKTFYIDNQEYYSINPLIEVGIENILKKKNFLYF